MRRVLIAAVAFAAVFELLPVPYAQADEARRHEASGLTDPPIYAEPLGDLGIDPEASAMAVIENETGTLIAGQGYDTALPMASTTKIMTALVALKYGCIDDMVNVPDEAVGVEGSSVYLCPGESISMRDLLYGLMLASGNDAAVAIACHIGGSVESFADMMNAEARSIGLVSTHFVTPNGLPAEGHHTTALELCLIAREALKLNEFRSIVSAKYYTTTSGDHVRTFKNKNKLLWDREGAIGVKTGYTLAAGRCLVFAAEKEGMTLIGALLNCRPMFEKASELLDRAFDDYTLCTVLPKGEIIGYAKVKNGVNSVLAAVTNNSIITVMQKGTGQSFTAEANVYTLKAPVKAGDVIGTVTVLSQGVPIAETELIAERDIEERGFNFWLRLLTGAFA